MENFEFSIRKRSQLLLLGAILILSMILGGLFLEDLITTSISSFSIETIQALSALLSALLAGLLVILYRQQKNVLESQQQIMEADYRPMFSYDNCSFVSAEIQKTFGDNKDISHDAAKFDAYNYGEGRAIKIRCEIVVGTSVLQSMDRVEQMSTIKQMARKGKLTQSAVREDSGLKSPHNSLDSREESTFYGKPYLYYLPTGEEYAAFQTIDNMDLSEGDWVTAIIIVEYQDVLGNSYKDIPYAEMFQFVSNTGLHEYPVPLKDEPATGHGYYQNIEFEE